MKIEDLKNYKETLSNLSKEDKKNREKYLRKLALGEIQGPQVGYPSIDKPQLAIYKEKEYFADRPKETITKALFRNNADNLDTVALEYFGSKITYGRFFENILDLIKALHAYGIQKGDYVPFLIPGIPEAMISIYSLGYLGASGMYMAPYQDIDAMISYVKKINSKVIFIMDLFYEKGKEKFDKVIEECGIEKVVVIPTLNSSVLGKFMKKKKYNDPKFTYYNDFIKEGENTELPEMVEYEENMPAAVVYSSGTTGVLKGVLLSHDSFNNSAYSYKAFGFDLSRGQKVYQAIPVWSSTGLIADGATALYYGCTLYQNPKFEPGDYSKNLGKKRINWGVATTELFNGLVDLCKRKFFKVKVKLNLLDYTNLNNIYIGGTFSTPKDKKRLEEILRNLGCYSHVNSSYGRCEDGSIVTAELNGHSYPDYSVGTPIPGVTVMAVDENCNELQYGQRGVLAVKTDCGMIDYYNRPDLKVPFFKDGNTGDLYKLTGDIGYVLPSGVVIYEGRANDKSVINGKELYNFDVKRVMLDDNDVFDCEVFSKEDGELYANIIFYDKENIDIDSKLSELQEKILEKFDDVDYIPHNFKIRDSFPMASSTKRDFKQIKSESDGYIRKDYEVKNIVKR